MSDLKLKKVTIRNWAKFNDVELAFPEKGLIAVHGINSASGGALQSVGSGKTALGEAISRTLLGTQGRFTNLGKFSRDKKGDTYVKVSAEFLGKPLVVESGYRCKEMDSRGEALRFTYDGKTIQRGLIKQTRDELVKLLGVPPLLANWTVFIDGRRMDFSQIDQSASVELVMSALRQPPWQDYHDNAKKAVTSFRRTMAREEQAHADADRQTRESTSSADDAKAAVTKARNDYERQLQSNKLETDRIQQAIDRLNETISVKRQRQQELGAAMKRIEETKATAHHQLEIQQRTLQESIRQSRADSRPLREALSAASTKATEERTHYNSYKNAQRECPTCKRAMGEGLNADHLSELKTKHEAAAAVQTKAQAAVNAHDQRVTAQEDTLDDVQTQVRTLAVQHDITEMSEEHQQLDATINASLNTIRAHEDRATRLLSAVSDAAVQAAEATWQERQRVLAVCQQKLAETAKALALSQETVKVLEYWNVAFSPYGIPNMVLRDAIAPLNHEAQRVSATMTGGTIRVVYNTTREMASGAEKAQLNIEVENLLGDKDLAGSSKGEGGLANFIIAETLAEVGQTSRRIGYRWYDEVAPNQDNRVCQTLYRYWKEMADKLGILIFMVDHNPLAANFADHTLVVEKKGTPAECSSVVYWR